ncbi:hypothetical protein DXG01_015377 [Tephrocybe rancida]|nr:hypothetical protein DXG01_015377 [Tephrocybe rancida]
MDDKRAHTLEALETFISSQKALLAQTHFDIARLQSLKNNAIASRPLDSLSNLEQQVKESPLQLSEAQLILPSEIDWTVYERHDPKALQNLNLNLREKRDRRNNPSPQQCSELSSLQKMVKDARRTILDPILAIYEGMSEPEDEPQEKLDPEEVRRRLEKEKLRELKKRKIHSWGGLRLPSQGVLGVFIRHDVEDESQDVDITLDDQPNSAMDVDTSSSSTPVFYPPPSKRLPTSPIPQRSRKPSAKAQSGKKSKSSEPIKRKAKSPPSDCGSSPEQAAAPSKPSRGKDKPKPETYKQQWSVSEQHLLEQLLDQIPEGEKNRWQKISLAMNGKRTPRQVASRVQKYFAKLKRFGI